jgi:hypothetical protein
MFSVRVAFTPWSLRVGPSNNLALLVFGFVALGHLGSLAQIAARYQFDRANSHVNISL